MTAPLVVTVRRFRCPFCSRSRSSRHAAVEHIDRCWANPAVRACKSCRHHQPYVMDDCGGRPGCRCADVPESCEAGVDLAAGIVTDCALWAPAPTEAS